MKNSKSSGRNSLRLEDVLAEKAKRDNSFLLRHQVGVLRKLIGLNLRYAAEDAGLKQPAIAKRAKLSQGEVSRIMNGQRNMTVDKIDRIARAVGKRALVLFVDGDPAELVRENFAAYKRTSPRKPSARRKK